MKTGPVKSAQTSTEALIEPWTLRELLLIRKTDIRVDIENNDIRACKDKTQMLEQTMGVYKVEGLL